mgnify:CR=1 FL=1
MTVTAARATAPWASLQSPTTGGLARRAERLLPSPIDTVQAVPSAEPKATWPIDLAALPPDWVHSSLATAAGSENGPILTPGKGADSVLVKKLKGQAGARMPLNRPPLSDAQIALVRNWIRRGAPND